VYTAAAVFLLLGKEKKSWLLSSEEQLIQSGMVWLPDQENIWGANPNPAWLSSLIEKGFDIYCGFDSDDSGDSLANRMSQLYPSVKRIRATKHDWNEELRSRSALD
jgi:hypothetical protein